MLPQAGGANAPGASAGASSGATPPTGATAAAASTAANPPPASGGPSAGGPAALPPGGAGGTPLTPSEQALLVEVQGENGAYYHAYLRDLFPDSGEVLLSFERDWQPRSRFALSRVRLPPAAPAAAAKYEEGQEIEVYSRASDQVGGRHGN